MNIPSLYHLLILWIGDGTGFTGCYPSHSCRANDSDASAPDHPPVTEYVLPLLFVVVLEIGNETIDYLNYGWRAQNTFSDLVNTLFWPFVISLAVRIKPMIPQTPVD